MLNYSKKLDRRILIPILIILAVFLLATTMQTSFAATNSINNTTTGGISGALYSSNSGDTIELDDGVYTGNNNINITINKNITIQGKTKDKVIIDAERLSRIYTIGNNLNVTFINIMFINGINTGDGGAIGSAYLSSTQMTFINCTFRDNYGTNNGGAIYSGGGIVNIINSTFFNNTSERSGGAVYFFNGSVMNSNFLNNSANNSYGAINSINEIFIDKSVFIGNTAMSLGGAVNLAKGNITNSIFDNNSADGVGAVVISGNSTIIFNSTFTENSAKSSTGGAVGILGNNNTLINCNFVMNSAYTEGGAVAMGGINNTIINCNFVDNHAIIGGAIRNSGVNTNLSNNIFINNTAISSSSGIIHNNPNTNISIINNEIIDNIGSGIYNMGNATIVNNTISNNSEYSIINTNDPNTIVIMGSNTISANLNQKSILAISSSVSGRVVNVNVKATDIVGNFLVGATVDFYVDGVLVGTGITDSDGVAQFTYTATKVGTNDIFVFMDEFSVIDVDDNEFIYSTVSNTTSVDVAKFNTNVTIVVSNATFGKSTIIRGVLVDDNGNPISGAILNVVIGGKSYSVVTGADGKWELPYTPSKAGNYNAKVYYTGDNLYLASTGSVAYNVAQEQEDIPTKVDIRLVKRNNSKAVRHGNVVYMKWLTFKNFGASGSQTINAKIIIKNLKYKLWKVYNKKLNYKFAKNNIKFKLNLKSNGLFKLKLKVYRPIKQK